MSTRSATSERRGPASSSGGRSRRRAPSTEASRASLIQPPPQVRTKPQYMSHEAANQIASDPDQPFEFWFVDSALGRVNAFLDQIIFSVLDTARSSTFQRINLAAEAFLKSKLYLEAAAAAEQDLADFVDPEDRNHIMSMTEKEPNEPFDLEVVFKKARIRVMTFMRFSDLEGDTEDQYLDDEQFPENSDYQNNANMRWSKARGTQVSELTSLFLCAMLEYIAELCVIAAARAAVERHDTTSRSSENESMTEPHDPNEPLDEDYEEREELEICLKDVEKITLDYTVGRLWRTWKTAIRPSRAFNNHRRSLQFGRSGRPISTGNARSVAGTSDEQAYAEEPAAPPRAHRSSSLPGQLTEPAPEELPQEETPVAAKHKSVPVPTAATAEADASAPAPGTSPRSSLLGLVFSKDKLPPSPRRRSFCDIYPGPGQRGMVIHLGETKKRSRSMSESEKELESLRREFSGLRLSKPATIGPKFNTMRPPAEMKIMIPNHKRNSIVAVSADGRRSITPDPNLSMDPDSPPSGSRLSMQHLRQRAARESLRSRHSAKGSNDLTLRHSGRNTRASLVSSPGISETHEFHSPMTDRSSALLEHAHSQDIRKSLGAQSLDRSTSMRTAGTGRSFDEPMAASSPTASSRASIDTSILERKGSESKTSLESRRDASKRFSDESGASLEVTVDQPERISENEEPAEDEPVPQLHQRIESHERRLREKEIERELEHERQVQREHERQLARAHERQIELERELQREPQRDAERDVQRELKRNSQRESQRESQHEAMHEAMHEHDELDGEDEVEVQQATAKPIPPRLQMVDASRFVEGAPIAERSPDSRATSAVSPLSGAHMRDIAGRAGETPSAASDHGTAASGRDSALRRHGSLRREGSQRRGGYIDESVGERASLRRVSGPALSTRKVEAFGRSRHPSVSSIGNKPRDGAHSRQSHASSHAHSEIVEREFDDLISGAETQKFTLTPPNLRDLGTPATPRFFATRNNARANAPAHHHHNIASHARDASAVGSIEEEDVPVPISTTPAPSSSTPRHVPTTVPESYTARKPPGPIKTAAEKTAEYNAQLDRERSLELMQQERDFVMALANANASQEESLDAAHRESDVGSRPRRESDGKKASFPQRMLGRDPVPTAQKNTRDLAHFFNESRLPASGTATPKATGRFTPLVPSSPAMSPRKSTFGEVLSSSPRPAKTTGTPRQLQARDPNVRNTLQHDLISAIRDGPSGASLSPADAASSNLRSNSAASGSVGGSMAGSVSSSSYLLQQQTRERERAQAQKRRVNKDIYSTDFVDEDDEDVLMDMIGALPTPAKMTARTERDDSNNNHESFLDFLKGGPAQLSPTTTQSTVHASTVASVRTETEKKPSRLASLTSFRSKGGSSSRKNSTISTEAPQLPTFGQLESERTSSTALSGYSTPVARNSGTSHRSQPAPKPKSLWRRLAI